MVDLVAVLRRAAGVSNTDRSLLTALADWMEKPLIDPAMGTRADHIARKIEALAEGKKPHPLASEGWEGFEPR